MKNLLVKKLKSKDGVSSLIAIMFFLVVIIVGAIVLTSASSANGKLSTMRQLEQDYLTVSSCAAFFKTELSEAELVISDGSATYTDTFEVLKTELEILASDRLISHGTGSGDSGIPFTVSSDPETGMENVYGSVDMSVSGKIYISLWLASDPGDTDISKGKNIITLQMDPTVTTAAGKTTYTWTEAASKIISGR